MKNIDRIFEISAEEALSGQPLPPGYPNPTYILPGLKQYREKYNKGNLVFDVRLGYKINDKLRLGLIANNVFNAEYSSRPGDIQPPRNFMAQLQMKF
jgi:iron complex outermembrane receptor protein